MGKLGFSGAESEGFEKHASCRVFVGLPKLSGKGLGQGRLEGLGEEAQGLGEEAFGRGLGERP